MELCNVEPLIDKSLSHFLVLADWNKIRFLFIFFYISICGRAFSIDIFMG